MPDFNEWTPPAGRHTRDLCLRMEAAYFEVCPRLGLNVAAMSRAAGKRGEPGVDRPKVNGAYPEDDGTNPEMFTPVFCRQELLAGVDFGPAHDRDTECRAGEMSRVLCAAGDEAGLAARVDLLAQARDYLSVAGLSEEEAIRILEQAESAWLPPPSGRFAEAMKILCDKSLFSTPLSRALLVFVAVGVLALLLSRDWQVASGCAVLAGGIAIHFFRARQRAGTSRPGPLFALPCYLHAQLARQLDLNIRRLAHTVNSECVAWLSAPRVRL